MGRRGHDPQAIEHKWQARWQADGLYRTRGTDLWPKFYLLTMHPYPSGDYLHRLVEWDQGSLPGTLFLSIPRSASSRESRW